MLRPILVTATTKFEVGRQYTFDPFCRQAIRDQFGFFPPDVVVCFDVQEPSLIAKRNGPYLEWDYDNIKPTVGFSIPLTRYVKERQVLRQFRINIDDLVASALRYKHRQETRLVTAKPRAKVKPKPARANIEDLMIF